MKRKQPFTFEEFKAIYSKVPRLCVDLIVRNDKGMLLVLRQQHGWIGQWHFPGGAVHFKEKVTDTIQRIAQEEIGTAVTVQKLHGYLEYFSEEQERGFGYSIALVFECTIPNDAVLQTDEQIEFFQTIPDQMVQEQKDFLKSI